MLRVTPTKRLPSYRLMTCAIKILGHSTRQHRPGPLSWLFLAKDFQNRRRVARQAIGAKENRPAQRGGATFDARDELFYQVVVSMLTDFSAQPKTGLDHQRHAHPNDDALRLDAFQCGSPDEPMW